MNNKITFPELIEIIAQKTNTSKRMSELFLKELFATVSQTLIEGDNVKIKGIGTFKLTRVNARKSVDVNTGEEIEIPGHNKLSFVPEKSLADAINQPFAQFDTVVLNDEVTDEDLAAVDQEKDDKTEIEVPIPQTPTEKTTEQANGKEEETEHAPATNITHKKEEEEQVVETPPSFTPHTDTEQPPVLKTETPIESSLAHDTNEPTIATENNEEPTLDADVVAKEWEQALAGVQIAEMHEASQMECNDEVTENDTENMRVTNEIEKRRLAHRSLLEGFFIGVVTTLVVAWASYKLYMMKYGPKVAQVEMAEHVKSQTNKTNKAVVKLATPKDMPAKVEHFEAPQKAAAQPKQAVEVLDTIKPGKTMTRMGRKHYGKDAFWVYIYEENKAKIKDPNNIPDGTVLIIPPASKYGIDKDNPASIEKAKKKEHQIYSEMLKQ